MPLPPQVEQWARKNYPRPAIDPDWLDGCYTYVAEELSLDVNNPNNLARILENVEIQLLGSDLRDSMTPSTGLPPVFLTSDRTLSSPPLLVEIVSITEVGHSAFQLQNTRQMRIDRADLAGLNAERGENGEQEEEEEGPVPRYPRSMLKLELTDGTVTFRAIEYKRMPDLVLGETPLGYKMLLKNVMFRQGIAFLEPANVVLKGHSTEDRQAQQDANFLRGLKRRMGLPEDDDDSVPGPPPAPAPAPVRAPAPAPAPAPPAPPASVNVRPPARATSPTEMDDFFNNEDFFNDEEAFTVPPVRNPPPARTTGQGSTTNRAPAPVPAAPQPLFLPSPSPERPQAAAANSDFEFDDDSLMADDSILAELDRVEKEAAAAAARRAPGGMDLVDSDDDRPLDTFRSKGKAPAARKPPAQTYEDDDVIDLSD